MGATFEPQTHFITYIPSGAKTVIADTLRCLPPGSITFEPREYFIAYIPSGIKSVNANTGREVVSTEIIHADTLRQLYATENIASDTNRDVLKNETVTADSFRELVQPRIILQPQSCFVAYIPSGIKTANADTNRELTSMEQASVDTQRLLGTKDKSSAPAAREVTKTETALAGTLRDTSSTAVFQPQDYFIAYIPSGIRTASAEMERRLYWAGEHHAVTVRDVFSTEIAIAQTSRNVNNSLLPNVAETGTERIVVSTNTVSASMIRNLTVVETATADTIRTPVIVNEIVAGTFREIFKNDVFLADVARKIPYILRQSEAKTLENYTASGIQSVSVSLGERTLSDVFEMTTVKPLEIEAPIKGTLLDYAYSFLVEETSQQNLVQTVKGMYGVDEMLYTPFSVTAAGTMCSTYAKEIADALGLKLSSNFEDFEPSQDYSESGITYQDLISALFGWTSRLPQRQINVFIRGDTLHILQRGMEESVLDITDWPHTRPVIDRKLIRSIWNNRSNDDGDYNNRARSDFDDGQIPFTGTIGVGHVNLRYVNGFLVHEENNGDETSYGYDGAYLIAKTVRRKDGTVIRTTYTYYKTANDIYLMDETEVTDTSKVKTDDGDDSDNEDKISTRSTYHAPIGGGWYLTSVYVDKEFQGSSLSQGPPGGKASQYMIDAMNRHLSSSYGTPSEPIMLPGTSLIDTSFPVKGDVFLRKLTLAIEWLNRKTQEEVSLEIVSNVRNGVSEIQHVVDFTERVKLDGNEYFLVSNKVELTPRSLLQRIRLVRWYRMNA